MEFLIDKYKLSNVISSTIDDEYILKLVTQAALPWLRKTKSFLSERESLICECEIGSAIKDRIRIGLNLNNEPLKGFIEKLEKAKISRIERVKLAQDIKFAINVSIANFNREIEKLPLLLPFKDDKGRWKRSSEADAMKHFAREYADWRLEQDFLETALWNAVESFPKTGKSGYLHEWILPESFIYNFRSDISHINLWDLPDLHAWALMVAVQAMAICTGASVFPSLLGVKSRLVVVFPIVFVPWICLILVWRVIVNPRRIKVSQYW